MRLWLYSWWLVLCGGRPLRMETPVDRRLMYVETLRWWRRMGLTYEYARYWALRDWRARYRLRREWKSRAARAQDLSARSGRTTGRRKGGVG